MFLGCEIQQFFCMQIVKLKPSVYFVKSSATSATSEDSEPNFGGYDPITIKLHDITADHINYKVVFNLRGWESDGENDINTSVLKGTAKCYESDVIVYVFSFYKSQKEALNLATNFMKNIFSGDKFSFTFSELKAIDNN